MENAQYIPPIPPEIVEKIIGYLGKIDVLNCRLVSQDWNRECLVLSSKSNSKFRQVLNRKNAADYMNWASSEAGGQMVLSFRVEFENLHADFIAFENVRNPNFRQWPYADFVDVVQKSLALFGSRSIRDLDITHYGPYDDGFFPGLFKLLGDVSHGLQKLKLNIGIDPTVLENLCEDLNFPNLKSLSYNSIDLDDDNDFPITFSLVDKCPNLESLSMYGLFDQRTIAAGTPTQFPPDGLKQLSLNSVGPIQLTWLLEKLQSHTIPPTLETLILRHCNIINNAELGENWKTILSFFSPNLQHLDFSLPRQFPHHFLGQPNPVAEEKISLVFPMMPKLKTLRIKEYMYKIHYEIDPSSFPVLESVNIPIKIRLNKDSEKELIFPSVTSLVLTIDTASFMEFEYNIVDPLQNSAFTSKEVMEQLFQLFPNIQEFTLYSESAYGFGAGYIIQLLKGLSQAKGSEKILKFKLCNWDHNYLGEVLRQIDSPPRLILDNVQRTPALDEELINIFRKFTGAKQIGITDETAANAGDENGERVVVTDLDPFSGNEIRLKNIKCMTLSLTQSARDIRRRLGIFSLRHEPNSEPVDDPPANLYLETMLKNFPGLEELRVSSLVFAPNAVTRAEKIKQIGEKYPNLAIDII